MPTKKTGQSKMSEARKKYGFTTPAAKAPKSMNEFRKNNGFIKRGN